MHKVSNQLTNEYSFIVVEELKLKNMTKRPNPNLAEDGKTYLPNMAKAKGGLNRVMLDLGIGYFFTFLDYKLIEKGGELIKVNPRNV